MRVLSVLITHIIRVTFATPPNPGLPTAAVAKALGQAPAETAAVFAFGSTVIVRPMPADPKTQAPNVAGSDIDAHPVKLSSTSADAAAPAPVPAMLTILEAGSETAFSDAREAVRRPSSSGTGLATRFWVFGS